MLALTALIVMVLAWLYRRLAGKDSACGFSAPRAWAPYETAAFGGFAFLLALNYCLVSVYPQFDIDMVAHILMKAKMMTDATYRDAFYFQDPVFGIVHSHYPPLTVFLSGFMFMIGLGAVADYHALNYFVFFLTGLALHGALRRRIPVWQSLAWTFVFFSTREYLANQFITSSTDIFLSLTVFLIAATVMRAEEDGVCIRGRETLLAVLCAAALFVKTDAIVFVVVLMMSWWIKYRRFPARHVIIIIMIVGPWAAFRSTLPNPGSGAEYVLLNLKEQFMLTNFWPAANAALAAVAGHWNGLFLAALVLCPLWVCKQSCRCLAGIVAVSLIVYFLVIWAIVHISPSHSQTFLRLLTHFYPLVLFLVARMLNSDRETSP